MRIAIDALGVVPNVSGGGETYVKGIVRGLAESGPEHRFLVFVTPGNRHLFAGLPANVELREARINNRIRPWRVLYEQLVLPARIRAWGADASFFPLNMMPLRMSRNERTVLCIHDASPLLYLDQFGGWWSRMRMRVVLWLERRSAQRASRVLTVSYFSAREVALLSGLPEHEILVVSPGITSLSDEVEGAADLRPKGRPYVLLVGRVNQHKRFDYFVRAFARAREHYGLKHAVVVVGAPGSGQAALADAVAECGLGDDVLMLGPVGAPELALLYSGADVFVLPSMYEGFGFPLLEALEFGVPSIASSGTSLPEVGSDAAIYVPPNNEEKMSEALGRLLADAELRRTLSERGRLRARQFTWQIAGRMLLSIVDALVHGEGPRGGNNAAQEGRDTVCKVQHSVL